MPCRHSFRVRGRLRGFQVPATEIVRVKTRRVPTSWTTWMEPNSNNGCVSDQSSYILMSTGYQPNKIGHQK
jgi:hypothetical protein